MIGEEERRADREEEAEMDPTEIPMLELEGGKPRKEAERRNQYLATTAGGQFFNLLLRFFLQKNDNGGIRTLLFLGLIESSTKTQLEHVKSAGKPFCKKA